MSDKHEGRFVSRAGNKLACALSTFEIDPAGWLCADLGSNVGGFVDCLLRHGAAKVYAVDTGYGALDWQLRKDPRVVVMERTNAIETVLDEPVRLVTVDVGWTRQQVILPRALELLDTDGMIVTLIKPHYEAPREHLVRGVLPDDRFEPTVSGVIERLADLGIRVSATVESPIRGDAGNSELLALVRRD